MKKGMLLVVVALVSMIGLTASHALAQDSGLAAAIEETDAKVAVLINEVGELSFYNTEGNALEQCALPGSDSEYPVCKGFTKEHAVIGLKALPILETEGSGCITFGPDSSGHYYQYCW